MLGNINYKNILHIDNFFLLPKSIRFNKCISIEKKLKYKKNIR